MHLTNKTIVRLSGKVFGSTISWFIGWVTAFGVLLKKFLGRRQVVSKVESNSVEILQIFESGLAELLDKTHSQNEIRTTSASSAGDHISQSRDRYPKPLDNATECSCKIQTMIENESRISMNTAIDMLKESVEEMYQSLEELKQTNSAKFVEITKTIGKGKEEHTENEKKVETKYKVVKDEIALQHRETNRRLERLEKKSNSIYFN